MIVTFFIDKWERMIIKCLVILDLWENIEDNDKGERFCIIRCM